MPTFPEPVRSRIAISEESEGLRISIRPTWQWAYLFIVVWLYLWTTFGVSNGRRFIHHWNLSHALWMLAWAFGEMMGAYMLLHVIGGREIIVVKADSLSRKSGILGLGFTKTYFAAEMSNLRFQVATGRRNVSRLAFDYGSKTVTFASDLDRLKQLDLLPRIRQRCAIANHQGPQESGAKLWGQ